MKKFGYTIWSFMTVFTLGLLPGNAFARVGAAEPWQLGFQEAASPVMERIHNFHDLMLYIIFGIAAFVLLLLVYVIIRYNAKMNPEPSKTTHNVMIEVIWTVIPIVILVIIAVPSLKMLYYMDRVDNPEMTIKAVGYQWYWGYEYPDHNDISFLSNLIPDDEIDESKGQKRLLSVDSPLVVPVETNIQIIVTAADVIHNFAVPALGVKMDGVPGRLNETWVYINEPGQYFGFCSELCGARHGFMPIEIIALPKDEFDAWAEQAVDGIVSYHEYKEQKTSSVVMLDQALSDKEQAGAVENK